MEKEVKLAGRSLRAELAIVVGTLLASVLSFGSVVALYASAGPDAALVARAAAAASGAVAPRPPGRV